jgi:formylglycine-generating enzyme required for sulfatase activity
MGIFDWFGRRIMTVDELSAPKIVDWSQAVEYCQKLTVQQRGQGLLPEGWAWRLPTEAEWEYAARAGTTTARHGDLPAVAWTNIDYRATSQRVHRVGQKQANDWGLHDVLGNVWEWCADFYGDYPTGMVTDPTGPSSGAYRVARGGSSISADQYCRSAVRVGRQPDYNYNDLGFRPALSPVR